MKSKLDLVKDWITRAKRDLLVAEREDVSEFSEIVCFHAQQAAEKSLKAFLVLKEIEFPKTHVLEDLADLASQADGSFEEIREDASLLTPYAVQT